MFKGSRTYLALIAIVIAGALGVIEIGGVIILSPEVSTAVVTLLTVLAAYFRKQA